MSTPVRSKAQWWYLSFCDAGRPKGTQFLGASVVRGASLAEAITASWELKCNPGGEVMAVEMPPGLELDSAYVDRLLTREEAENMPEPTMAKGNKP